MKKETVQFGMRLPKPVRDALAKAARDKARSMSSMASIILSGWLTERGYLVVDKMRKMGRE